MDSSTDGLLVVFFICLLLSAFFSSAESSFVALPKLRLRYMKESGIRGANQLTKLAEKPGRYLSTVLLGNNIVNVAAATLGTIVAVTVLGPLWGPISATVGVTALLLIFGEVVPKTFAIHHAQRLALLYTTPIRVTQFLFYPIVMALEHIGWGVTQMVAGAESDTLVSEGEIRSVIDAGESEGVVEQGEAKMLHKIFEFTDRPVSKIMIPRTEIRWLEQGTTLNDFMRIYANMPYSRFPVYADNTDNVTGILFAKDVLMRMSANPICKENTIDDLVRPAHFIPESKHLGELLKEMRKDVYHIAIVVDEFGGIAGMITLGQLTEEIVGDIRDEMIEEDEDFVVTGDNTFQLDGGFRVEDANAELSLNLPSGDYETVAGFILSRLGRVPKQGEQLKYRNLKFVVTEMQRMKIEKVMVTREKDGKTAS